MTHLTSDPVDNNTERVLVRNTATGFEQGIAATAGFFTAGPLGALASWGTIRGLQGKWTPWFILGIPAAIGINVVNVGLLVALNSNNTTPEPAPQRANTELTTPFASNSNNSLPAYNIANNGGSTLVEKCEAIAQAQRVGDVGKVFQYSYAIGAHHDTPLTSSVDEDCASVGVNTY